MFTTMANNLNGLGMGQKSRLFSDQIELNIE